MTTVSDNSPRAPLVRSQLAREDLLRHTTIFLTSTGTNATATLAMLQDENHFFLLTAQHVARMIEAKGERWSYQNPEQVVKYLNHPPIRTDLGKEGLYSQDLTLLKLHAEDAAEMVRVGLRFYDLSTSQYLSDEEVVVDGVRRFVEVEAVEADYSGMSGGGLWEVSYPASGGHRVFLVGVVVREPQQLQSSVDTCSAIGSATIRCSSRESIKELVSMVRSLVLRGDEQHS